MPDEIRKNCGAHRKDAAELGFKTKHVGFSETDRLMNVAAQEFQTKLDDWGFTGFNYSKLLKNIKIWDKSLWDEFIKHGAVEGTTVECPEFCYRFEWSRRRYYGYYVQGRSGSGQLFEIGFNPNTFFRSSHVQIAETLLHEMWHAAEHIIDRKATKNNYHSAWFRRKVKRCGIPCDDRGRSSGIDIHGLFWKWAKERKIQDEPLVTNYESRIRAERQKRKPKRLKWMCRCETILYVAYDTRIQAHCDRCNMKFVPIFE